MFLSIIIPAYNEAQNIEKSITEIREQIQKEIKITNYEIILIDDHSEDSTFDIVKKINHDKVRCLRLSRHSGSHTAIRAGIDFSKGDSILCLAADGQDDPSVLSEIITKKMEGFNIVWAIRKKRDESFVQIFTTTIFYSILKIFTKTNLSFKQLSLVDFFLIDQKVITAIKKCKEKNTSLFGLLAWLGFNYTFVEYNRRVRRSGNSKWDFNSKMLVAKDWIIAFSGIPLRISTYMGIAIAGTGFLYALYVITWYFLGTSPPGWASTIVISTILGGTQLIMLGILGEYLWRNLDESRKRPLYLIEMDTKSE